MAILLNFFGLFNLSGIIAQGAPLPPTEAAGTTGHHLLYLVVHADPIVQLSLLILLAFSIVSWAIIVAKHRQLRQDELNSQEFLQSFWETKKITDMPTRRIWRKSAAYRVFLATAQALEKHHNPGGMVPIEREGRRAYESELEGLEYGVPFLATTASAAPFIGLFGTVWGILNAFWKIGQVGASSLSVVGPHIAEALIATAIGLAAAIPAVIFYNVYVNRIRRISKDLEDFTEDLQGRIKKEYFA